MLRLLQWFEKLVAPFPDTEIEQPPQTLRKFILYCSRGLWKFLIPIAILNSIIAGGEAFFFFCMGKLVDWTTNTHPVDFIDFYGNYLLIMLMVAGVVLPLASLLHSLLLHQTIAANFPMRVRWLSHRYLLNQSLAFFSEEFAGRIANKVMQTAISVRTAVEKAVDVVVHFITCIVVMFWLLADADIYLGLPFAVWLVITVFVFFFFVPRLSYAVQRQSDSRSEMVGRVVDSYMNIATVKLFGGGGKETRYAKDSMNKYIETEYAALRILTGFEIAVQFINYTLIIVLTMTALWLWSSSVVTAGSIAIAIAIAVRVVNLSRWMMWELGMIYMNIGTAYDGMNTISKPVTVKDPENPKEIAKAKGDIRFDNVSFSYIKGKPIFEGLNLDIKAGEKVGIVGPSGAGKSTLVNLILRFYDIDKGTITLDGINIRDLRQDDLRRNFSMVSQDTSLMHRTIEENICYGSENPDEISLRNAVTVTDSVDFIEALSDYRGGRGMSTMVGERGVKLSGGQRQRIALARVVLRDSPILILDEATSALDSETEQLIQDNLKKIIDGRTVIAIAHRLSTLSIMDRIVVIDKGRIVESGTQQELISQNGLFASLWHKQSKGFIGKNP
ncbi:MAG TPA: multidrug ABC transporter ATP-binding protein [Succinivibrionaceae bacterium]|nr:multidrug ABC transporter ATP-binding protein [Succinivibrionaceae bacterium]